MDCSNSNYARLSSSSLPRSVRFGFRFAALPSLLAPSVLICFHKFEEDCIEALMAPNPDADVLWNPLANVFPKPYTSMLSWKLYSAFWSLF